MLSLEKTLGFSPSVELLILSRMYLDLYLSSIPLSMEISSIEWYSDTVNY